MENSKDCLRFKLFPNVESDKLLTYGNYSSMAHAINCSLFETIPNRKCNKLYTFGNFSQIAKSNKLFPL